MMNKNGSRNKLVVNNEVHPAESTKLFKIEVLHMIKTAQQHHGLRHGDYQRYRGYCSRRIRRLRKALKYPQGDRRHFKRRDVTSSQLMGKDADQRFIYIPLMNAERAWAYAMQLKQEANTEPRKRFHMISKLRKACFHAMQLQDLCNMASFDARTKLECEAYTAWIHGTLHFELQLWKTAAEHLKRAQVVYENLANALTEDEQELYKVKVNELAPNLRYCAYNMNSEKNSDCNMDDLLEMRARGLLGNLDVLINQTKTETNDSVQVIEWRNRKISVRLEKVRLFLLSVEKLDKSLEKTESLDVKIDLIERVLIECKDAIQAVKDEVKQDSKLRLHTSGQSLLTYLSYIRHSRTLQRNLCLVEQAKLSFNDPNRENHNMLGNKRVRAQDLARLYEIILQNVSEMQQIFGMEADTTYQIEITSLLLTFKAFRCYYIAITLIDMKKWKEAVALYERASNYANESLKTATNTEFDMTDELRKLIATIDGCKYSAHAYSVLEATVSSNTQMEKSLRSKPLFERLTHYLRDDEILNDGNVNVYQVTPEMETISCKPLFFDLALNYVEFPPIESKRQSLEKKGISSFMKGFLGWGSNK